MNPAIARRIVFVIYPGFDLLDLSGPLAVFNDANHLAGAAYDLTTVSAEGGPVASSSGVAIATSRPPCPEVHTLVALGGPADAFRHAPTETLDLVSSLAAGAQRVASVCTGAFLLAKAGLLDGKRATTHWRFSAELQAAFPKIRVDSDKIFVRDDRVWTSAGATAGIDLALALIEEDLGPEVSRMIARALVVYHRRLGGQSQYSALLDLEPRTDRIRRALNFARDHLHEDLPVARLAQAASLSERQFGRAFVHETGMTPAKAVEKMRAEIARPMIEDSRQPLEDIARSVGFTDAERMCQAFIRSYGHSPRTLRRNVRDL